MYLETLDGIFYNKWRRDHNPMIPVDRNWEPICEVKHDDGGIMFKNQSGVISYLIFQSNVNLKKITIIEHPSLFIRKQPTQ